MRSRLLAAAALAAALQATATYATTYSNIAAANASSSGGTVTVNNVTLSSVLNYSATNGYNLDLQDSSGGVQAYRFPASAFSGFTPAVGDIVDVTATNDPYEDNPEFSNTSAAVSLVSAGTFTPATVTAAQANGATTNGLIAEMVTVPNVIITDDAAAGTTGTTFTSDGTYDATDSTGSLETYIYNSDSAVAALEGQTIPTTPVNITGYLDYYSGGGLVEIYPTAISAVPEPASLGLLVLGGLATLTRRRGRAGMMANA